jgi:hypothetical protein
MAGRMLAFRLSCGRNESFRFGETFIHSVTLGLRFPAALRPRDESFTRSSGFFDESDKEGRPLDF